MKTTRRTVLTSTAATAAGAVAAAAPAVASTSTPGPNDRRLWDLAAEVDQAATRLLGDIGDTARDQATDTVFRALRGVRETPADSWSGLRAKASAVRAYRRVGAEVGEAAGESWFVTFHAAWVPEIAGQLVENLSVGNTLAGGTPMQDPDQPIHDLADRWWQLEGELEAFDGEVPDGDTRAEEQGEIARELADKKAATVAGARRKASVKLRSGCGGVYGRLGDSALSDLTRLGEAA